MHPSNVNAEWWNLSERIWASAKQVEGIDIIYTQEDVAKEEMCVIYNHIILKAREAVDAGLSEVTFKEFPGFAIRFLPYQHELQFESSV